MSSSRMALTNARNLGNRIVIRDVPQATLADAIEVLRRNGGGVGSPDQARINNLKFASDLLRIRAVHSEEGRS